MNDGQFLRAMRYICNGIAGKEGGLELTRVALVAVLGRLAAGGDLESRLGDDLVEGVGAAGEDLAGVAVAQDVALLVGLEGPLPLVVAAVALGLVGGCHCE
jgi:hypothetical protein